MHVIVVCDGLVVGVRIVRTPDKLALVRPPGARAALGLGLELLVAWPSRRASRRRRRG